MARRQLFSSRSNSFDGGRDFGTSGIRNPERELFLFQRRLAVAGVLVLLAFIGLFGRFVYLQVFQHDHFSTLAESNRIAIVPIVPNRGVITDRNGIVLAQSYSAYTLELTPSKIANLDATIDELAEIVDVQPRDRKRFRKLIEEAKNFESLPLRTRLSDEEVAKFAVNRYRFPGVEIKARLFRQYPFGETASHLDRLHRAHQRARRRVASPGMGRRRRTTRAPTISARSASRLSFERELHGTTGVEEQVEVDAGGRAVRTLSRTPPTLRQQSAAVRSTSSFSRSPRRAFGDRRGAHRSRWIPATGDSAGLCFQAGDSIPISVRRRHRLRRAGTSVERFAGQADAEPPIAWRLSTGLDHQAVSLRSAALASGKRTPHAGHFRPRLTTRFAGSSHTGFATTNRADTATVDMYQVDRCFLRHVLLHAGRRDTDIDDTYRVLVAIRLWPRYGHRHRW